MTMISPAEARMAASIGDPVSQTRASLTSSRENLRRLESEFDDVEKAIAAASSRKDEKQLGRLCAKRLGLIGKIQTARANVTSAEGSHKSARNAAIAAALTVERADILARWEAFFARYKLEYEVLAQRLVSIMATARNAQLLAERVSAKYNETLRVEIAFCSARFQRELFIKRLLGGGFYWNGHYHDLSERRDLEALEDFSLSELQALAQAPQARGAEWEQHVDKTNAALRDAGKRLATIYVECVKGISDLMRDEWRLRRDVFDFNSRASGYYAETLFLNDSKYWRPVGQMAVDILLPHPTKGKAPLLSGSTNPATLDGWDDGPSPAAVQTKAILSLIEEDLAA